MSWLAKIIEDGKKKYAKPETDSNISSCLNTQEEKSNEKVSSENETRVEFKINNLRSNWNTDVSKEPLSPLNQEINIPDKDDFSYVDQIRDTFEKKFTLKAKRKNEDSSVEAKKIDYENKPFDYVSENFNEEQGYNKLRNYKCEDKVSHLPIHAYRKEILKLIRSNEVCVIQGNTGCGKTTQVPLMILDEYARENKYCNIIVSQPRRIAAHSVCIRVSEERRWDWHTGVYCGFQTGLNKIHKSNFTRILYVTTGLLLRRIVSEKNEISKYTHIILDEIHERELDMDFILLILKLLRIQGFTQKIILMSATCNAEMFCEYFSKKLETEEKINIPSINCPYNMHKVTEYYLEDIERFSEVPIVYIDEPKYHLSEETYLTTISNLLYHFDDLEFKNGSLERGSVLIFVPGIEQIELIDMYLRDTFDRSHQLITVRLYGEQEIEQQSKAFLKPFADQRKVVISTSIAESSLTIPDIKYIIDMCLSKSKYCEEFTNHEYLRTEWASKTSLIQRKGRAGRVMDGFCYRLINKKIYEKLEENPKPEMLRAPLDKIVLKIKKYDEYFKGSPKEVLSMAVQPPKLDKIETTIIRLKMLGALCLHKKGKIDSYDGVLTYCGRVMESIPVEIRYGKLILLGHAFGKLRECIILAAAFSSKSIFVSKPGSVMELYKAKFYFSDGYFCDFICIINAYNMWRIKVNQNEFKNSQECENWCKQHYLSLTRLNELKNRKKEIETCLKEFHIVVDEEENDEKIINEQLKYRDNVENSIRDFNILKMIIAGAFYPNYCAVKSINEKDALEEVYCYNPRNTVKVSGFDRGEAILYTEKIRDLFIACANRDDIKVHLNDNKAYVEFKSSSIKVATNVECAVYLAICLKKLKHVDLYVHPVVNSKKHVYLKEIDKIKNSNASGYVKHYTKRMTVLNKADDIDDPTSLISHSCTHEINILSVIECGHFWAQISDKAHNDVLKTIESELNSENYNLTRINHGEISIGKLIVALRILENDNNLIRFQRAKVLKINDGNSLDVVFVDNGYKQTVDMNAVFELSESLKKQPFQAFQCKIINIKPKISQSRNKTWSKEATNKFTMMLTKSHTFEISIYSIIENVVRVELYDKKSVYNKINIGTLLQQYDLAEFCEESNASKDNNDKLIDIFSESSKKGFSQKSNSSSINMFISSLLKTFEFNKHDRIVVKGPDSGLETTLKLLTRVNQDIGARVESDSINYVLLDDDPQIETDRLLIAGDISFDPNKDIKKSSLKNTCLLPKIKGLLPLTCMLYAPFMELRVNAKEKRYTGAICGLGYDKILDNPVYAEYDIETEFDCIFDDQDFNLIEAIRVAINLCIQDDSKAQEWQNNSARLKKIQSMNRNFITSLLEKNRESCNKSYFHGVYEWNKIPEGKFLGAQDYVNILYPKHCLPRKY